MMQALHYPRIHLFTPGQGFLVENLIHTQDDWHILRFDSFDDNGKWIHSNFRLRNQHDESFPRAAVEKLLDIWKHEACRYGKRPSTTLEGAEAFLKTTHGRGALWVESCAAEPISTPKQHWYGKRSFEEGQRANRGAIEGAGPAAVQA